MIVIVRDDFFEYTEITREGLIHRQELKFRYNFPPWDAVNLDRSYRIIRNMQCEACQVSGNDSEIVINP